MTSVENNLGAIKSLVVKEVPAGNTTVLNCLSNDNYHNFMFWLFNSTDVIGPGNPYNEQKYKYEVLSGNLYIHNVSPHESGFYYCISRNINGLGYTVGLVDMIVTTPTFTLMDAVKLVAIVLSLLVLTICVILYVHYKKDWNKYEDRVVVPVDEVEEDEDGGEVYNRTTTTIYQPSSIPGPSRNVSSEQLYGIDNQGLDTDFNSVFENIQIKSPQISLI